MENSAHALFLAARDARAKAHAPYSNFRVGVAIRGVNNKVYTGCNIENAALPEGWCAETSAISHMIMDGERNIAEVCVIGSHNAYCTPCGGCRQRLREFGELSVPVHIAKEDGIVETLTIGELLPHGFELEIS